MDNNEFQRLVLEKLLELGRQESRIARIEEKLKKVGKILAEDDTDDDSVAAV